MIGVSQAWKDIQPRFLLPETYVEIDCTIVEGAVQASATIEGENESRISKTISALDDDIKSIKYATNELNFWALDGSRVIAPDLTTDENVGYVSEVESRGSVVVRLPEVHVSATSGVTITWGGRYDEYPTVFEIIAKNESVTVFYKKIENNTSQVTPIFEQLQNYDSITINVLEWSLPHRRVRIENVVIGHIMTFKKKDIISYSHEQFGHLNSGELPKNTISFSLDNTDGRWDPTDMGQYLSERQKIVVRYGLDINGSIEWIKAGTFYLSEWRVPANGLEAHFVARDIFEYLLNEPYTGPNNGSLYDLCTYAFHYAGVPEDFRYMLDDVLRDYFTSWGEDKTYTCAEILQMCANAGKCVIYQDRDGVLWVMPLKKISTDYMIPLSLSYSHPEIELSKPIKSVSVTRDDETTYVLTVGDTGETQTVNNPLIGNQQREIAEWVRDTLATRKTISGEFRADPRLDVFDIVTVQSKYGDIINVAITDIKYTYNGSFKGAYTGKVLGG